jgi:hypothetical protein
MECISSLRDAGNVCHTNMSDRPRSLRGIHSPFKL